MATQEPPLVDHTHWGSGHSGGAQGACTGSLGAVAARHVGCDQNGLIFSCEVLREKSLCGSGPRSGKAGEDL